MRNELSVAMHATAVATRHWWQPYLGDCLMAIVEATLGSPE
jgi:hypothetical protein